jgi:hypothetical protein
VPDTDAVGVGTVTTVNGQQGGVERREVTAGADVRGLYEARPRTCTATPPADFVERLADITGV